MISGPVMDTYGRLQNTLQTQLGGITNAAALPYNQAAGLLDYDLQSARIGVDYDRRGLNLNHWADMNRLGNSQYRDVDLARQGVQDDLASGARRYNTAYDVSGRRYNDTRDAANGAYGIDWNRLNDQLNFGQTRYGNAERFLGREGQLNLRDRQLGMQGATLRNDAARRGAFDQAAASGSATSSGFGANLGELRQQLGLDQAGVTQQWNRATNDLTRNVDNNRVNWAELQQDVSNGRDQATLTRDTAIRGAETNMYGTRQDANNSWADTQEGAVTRNKYIDSVANDYGISRDQMEQAFKLGSERLGLDYATVVRRLTTEQTNLTAQGTAATKALEMQILMAAQQGAR